MPNDDEIADLDRRLKEASPAYHANPISTVPVQEQAAANDVSQVADNPAKADAHDSEIPAPIVIHDVNDLRTPAMQKFDERYQNEGTVTPFPTSTPPMSTKKPENIELDVHDKTDQSQNRFPELQYIGQLQGTFLLAQAGDGLYIIDQHAAQERINYEYYRQKIGEVSPSQQNFLVPLVLNYSTVDALTITQHLDTLAAVGLNLESFGQNSFILRSHPTWFKEGQEEDTAKEMIDWLIKNGKLTVKEFRMKTAIMMSCKRAIKANHHLDEREAKALLKRLPQCENPFNCPHGRPVTVHFDDQDLEKMFKRIQDSHTPYADDFDDHEF